MSDTPAPGDDIRADIMAAMKGAEPPAQPETPAADASEQPQNEAEQQLSQPNPERARAQNGQFTKRDEKSSEAAPERQNQAAATPAPVTAKAPESWTADMKAVFGSLDPKVQAYIAQRETESNKKITAQDEERSFGRKMRDTLSPYLATIQQEGGTPEQAVASLLQTAMVLRSPNPQIRTQALRQIAQQFNVELGSPLQQGAAPQQGYDPAHVTQLVQAEIQRHQQHQEVSTAKAEVDAFAAAPGHEHYDAVKPVMAALLADGGATDLQDAYDKACWSNPEIRSTLIAAQTQQTEQKRITEAQARADAAKRVAVSVKGGPGANQPANGAIADRSLREELLANLQAATAGRI